MDFLSHCQILISNNHWRPNSSCIVKEWYWRMSGLIERLSGWLIREVFYAICVKSIATKNWYLFSFTFLPKSWSNKSWPLKGEAEEEYEVSVESECANSSSSLFYIDRGMFVWLLLVFHLFFPSIYRFICFSLLASLECLVVVAYGRGLLECSRLDWAIILILRIIR